MEAGGRPEPRLGTWLILGGTGFLGRHIRQAALEAPAVGRVVAASRNDRPGVDGDWVRLDLARDEPARIAEVLADVGPSVVVNAAGAAAGGLEAMTVGNVLAVARLLEAVDRVGLPLRLVHLGSAAEYGPPSAVGRPLDERAAARPVSGYGVLKLAATGLVLGAAGNVEPVVLRLFNPVGVGMSDASLPGRAARRMREALRAGDRTISMGPLGAYRDFVDARDVAQAVVASAAVPGAAGTIVNIGSGRATLVRDLVTLLAEVAGYDGVVAETAAGSSRSTGVDWQAADVTRAADLLAWEPAYDLRSSVEALWNSLAGA